MTYDPTQPPAWQGQPDQPPAWQGQPAPDQAQAQQQYPPAPYTAPQYSTQQTGYPQPGFQGQAVAPKNPAVGLLLSLFIPGLGSMVSGNVKTGVIILVTYVVGFILTAFIIGLPIVIGAWIWGMVDGYQSAQRWNQAHGIIS